MRLVFLPAKSSLNGDRYDEKPSANEKARQHAAGVGVARDARRLPPGIHSRPRVGARHPIGVVEETVENEEKGKEGKREGKVLLLSSNSRSL